jgi:hypothetical protein
LIGYSGDFMVLKEFEFYLRERKLDDNNVEQALALLNDFADYLSKSNKTLEDATYDDIHDFSAFLIENERNLFDNYIHLLRFGYFKKNNPIIIACMEIIDGEEVIRNFSNRLTSELSEDIRNKVFKDMEVPPLGLHPSKRPTLTKALVKNLIEELGEEKSEEFLSIGLRDKYTEWYKADREMFLQSKDIDEFLQKKQTAFVNELKKHQKENSLFFTQEIDDSVINYVEDNKCGPAGIREGNKVFLTKIPYLTKQFLKEKDPRKKKYYGCHCPWVREALLTEDSPINPIFCNCSGGYFKNHWEAILEQPVKIELVESILMGNEACKFILHLPSDI